MHHFSPCRRGMLVAIPIALAAVLFVAPLRCDALSTYVNVTANEAQTIFLGR